MLDAIRRRPHLHRVSNTASAPLAERTTVSLPRALLNRLRLEARAAGLPVSTVVRAALESYFARAARPRLPSFAGSGASGRSDVSERAEELLQKRFKTKRRG
jgi:hypothetical protein